MAMWVPPPRIDLASWIEANVILPEGMTGRPGLVELFSYQRGICDAISDPEVERITVVKSARLGYTTLLTGMIASYVANDPSQILVVLPAESDCRDYMVNEIEPVFAASDTLRGKLSDDSDPNKRNTILSRRFPGGTLKIVGANAPRALRRHNVRVLIIDEAAAMDADSAAGSVVARAIGRTRGFTDRKIIEGSTPLDDTSNVLLSYAQSNRSRFEVPCPSCGGFTYIEWSHIVWEPGQPDTAAFLCPHCQTMVPETHKAGMVAAGRWIAQAPEVKLHHGFLINALVSPLPKAAWRLLVAEFLAAKDDPHDLKVFVNETLAEPWNGDRSDIDEDKLRARAERFDVNAMPEAVLALTAGVDVQDDRLEVTLVGWSRDATFVLDHQVIWGSPDDDQTWQQLDAYAGQQWVHPFGGKLRLDAMAVDSGDGDWTTQVYRYCFPRLNRRILAIKGAAGSRPPIERSRMTVKGGTLFIVGVDGLKSTIMARLERGDTIRFSDTLQEVYFEQLASERKIVRRVRGQPRAVWDRIPGRRAESLDCLVYGFAARSLLGNLNFENRAAMLRQGGTGRPAQPQTARPATRRRTVRSNYMQS
jgi:phage terminase large subunit GpA-like protein